MSENEAKLRDYLKRATADLRKTRRRLDEMETNAREPIAIVGMACRYPGGANGPDGLWELLSTGRDGIAEFPADRGWELERLYSPNPDDPRTSYSLQGGFLPDAVEFDAEFFGIGPREALAMDPQQRLFLETCWEAVEDAGIDLLSLRGHSTGVFAGISSHDYGVRNEAEARELEGYLGTGTVLSVVSGRVAYALGLEGPAITVDTACSSSLVSLHLACRALRARECSLALAGGVTVLATPGGITEMSRQRGLARDGRCKSFADAADGTGFSEGVGVVLVERLSDAQREGHPVLAVLRGSAVNQDGASNGLTAPNGPSQERVIRQALADARLAPRDVDAVEAHGTGTTLGDPIEAGALLATYGQDREEPLRLGSIKSNIGHTQAAAGAAGVIKMVMAMREGLLPKSLHIDRPSSKVDWSEGEIELLTEPRPWKPNGKPRRAAVSSFGISGTNAHVILEEAPEPVAREEEGGDGAEVETQPAGPPLPGQVPLLLSAKTEPALQEAAARLRSHLAENPSFDRKDVAYSLATTRTLFEQRAVALAPDKEHLLGVLEALAEGREAPGLIRGRANPERRAVFIFPGQGSQWQGMAAGLLESSPVFATQMRACEEALAPYVDFSVREVLERAEGAPSIERAEVAQPTLFSVMVSLAELWRSCGVEPAAVLGHSQGEIAAAYVAGGLSLADAARIVALRSQIIVSLPGDGAMASVRLPAAELTPRLESWEGQISVAALNGPASTILSGDREALGRLLVELDEEGVQVRDLSAAKASHSHYVEALREQVLEALAPISPRRGDVPFHSTVSGGLLDTGELDADYWYRNMREPVRFEEATRGLLEAGRRIFLESSPHPAFAFAVRETIEDALADPGEASVLGSLRRDEGGPDRFVRSLAEAHAAGVDIDWQAFFQGTAAKRVPLPTYPFQRKRYWLEGSANGGDPTAIGQIDAEHPLLGAAIALAGGEQWLFTGRLSLQSHPWLADHAIGDTVLLPGTAFLELALQAGKQAGAPTVSELTLEAPLVLPEQGALQLQVSLADPDEEGERQISIHSRPEAAEQEEEGEWATHATGTLSSHAPEEPEALEHWPPEGAEPLDVADFYERLAEAGFEYGPAFQGLGAAWQAGEEIYAEVSLDEAQLSEAERYGIHPALLDAALHGIVFLAAEASEPLKLPFSWGEVSLHGRGAAALRVKISTGPQGASLVIADPSGSPVAQVGSLSLRPLSPEQLQGARQSQQGLLGIEWQELSLPEQGKDEAPEVTFYRPEPDEEGADLPTVAKQATEEALAAIQEWLATERPEDARFVLVTQGAIATVEGESPDLAQASLWGLVRSAQSEHPGSFVLIDSDGTDASEAAISSALASGEPQVALREGKASVPRATRIAPPEEQAPGFDPEKTILITGATGALGSRLARHLAEVHGAEHLLLTSRSGSKAKGAKELQAQLKELGAKAKIAACDVSDKAQVKALLDSITESHPLGAVIHAAGTIDDGLIDSMSPERIERVFAPKADGAWNLHELTKGQELSAFITFSSLAATLGGPGQSNYAAANAFLDGLASQRAAKGLAASSIAWGYWASEGAMTEGLSEIDRGRMERSGVGALSDEEGLGLFDAALATPTEQPLAVRLIPASLRALAKAGALHPLLQGLVRGGVARRGATGGAFAAKLAQASTQEQQAILLELVREEVARVLGHESAEAIDPQRSFKDLGFDSLAAVELRNRLSALSGLRLPPTVVFDYPTAAKLAAHLLAEATAGGAAKQAVKRRTASEEPIAILGMACRYPGGVGDPEELWQLLEQGTDGISEFPTDRGWDTERLYHPDPEHRGTSYAKEGGFLEAAADFDAEFFGIGPREATAIDPQQRLLLESCWEALEDAGIDPSSLGGSQTGVFAGVMNPDYGMSLGSIPEEIEGYLATGLPSSVASGRIAYALGLEGPAMTVDTACSSSLVALHLAAQALRNGECDLALSGGVTVLSTPNLFTQFSRQRGLAPDGRCKSFADAADGTGAAEGVGMLLVSRLSDAEREGHPILAVLKGSAVNQDGASNGLTAPNGPSQERVIRQALANARLTPKDIDVVEAHGTGTTLGDPIEAGALLATYGQDREEPLRLGSIKSNIGHTQAAAGAAGVIKMVMAMREGLLPKSLHIDAPSSKVDWGSGAIELLTEPQAWEPNGRPRRAAVSSFGISGTNAHVILEEAPAVAEEKSGEGAPVKPLPTQIPLAISAKSEGALREAASRLHARLQANPNLEPADVAYSLTATRSLFEHRAVALGESREELLAALDSLAEGTSSSNAISSKATPGKLAYLFSGQGAQRAEMGKELYETHPVFKEALDQACAEIDPHLDRSLKDLLFASKGSKEAELLDHTQYTQPALFAIELALYRQLESQGLKPDLLAGHSIGEITAAHIAGVLDLSDAAKLICARGALMGELPAGGAMVAVEATEAEANSFLEDKGKELAIAAINSPSSVVLSGREEEIEEAQAHFEAQGKKTKRLSVSHAFHSPLIEPMLEDFAKLASSLSYAEPQIPIVSNLSGELLDPSQAQDPAYWVSQARDAVRFADSVKTLAKLGATTFVEIGPEPALSAMAAQTLEADEHSGTAIPTLREGRDEAEALSGALARAHASGASVDWSAFFAGTAAKRVPLPTYPFQRKRYWLEGSANGGDPTAIGQIDAEHPLLGAAIALAGGEQWLFTGRLSLQSHPWLADHAIGDTVLLPGTAFLELALQAGKQAGAPTVSELTLEAPLVLPEQGALQLQVSLADPDEEGERQISIHSRPEAAEQEEEGEWATHATGTLSSHAPEEPEALEHWPPEGAEPLDVADFYERLAEAGFEYGPAFQGLGAAWQAGEEIYAEVSLDEAQLSEAERYGIHPALLDAALHGIVFLAAEASEPLKLPFSWGEVSLHGRGAAALRVKISTGPQGASLVIADPSGSPVAQVGSLSLRPLSPEQLQGARQSQQGLLGIEWQELSLPEQGKDEAPEVTFYRPEPDEEGADLPTVAKQATEEALAAIQEWLATERPEDARFVLVTQGAIATVEGESPDLAQASLWGLVRSAQSEHPGSFVLIDSDGTDASEAAISSALASGEPQVALREGKASVPRATRIAPPEEQAPGFDPEKTILITGATGALGSRLARHLAEVHGAEHLLLTSRSGSKAKGAKELQAQLKELGAKAKIAACDVSDKAQVKALLDSITESHPLGAVIHAAGTIDDGLIDSMSPERIERVFAPKADGAWNLHELTKGQELSAFITFSSLAATLGGPGQSNYAAANAFLDGLASQRAAKGLAASSIAWGYWASEGAMTEGLSEIDRGRMERSGVGALSDEEGLGLFDAALATPTEQPLAVRLIPASLRALAKADALHPLLQGLVRVSGARSAAADSLARKLAAVPEAEREAVALELVRAEVATVLGHTSAGAIEPKRPFKELGFDSLAAVELRNRLSALSGLRLPPTVVFDYPTAAKLAAHLLAEATAGGAAKQAVKHRTASEEPIAILGMACRYPGGVSDPTELWALLSEGTDGVTGFPPDRGWDTERLYHPDPEHSGTSYAKEGGFLEAAADFDAEFFGIGPREAIAIDPQQRLLLESCWEALEDAGIDPSTLAGSQTGVFAGMMNPDYGVGQGSVPEEVAGYLATGMATSVASGRIAYALGLEGPAMTVDTACSSSLVTLHLASQALRSGECDLALAGGVTVLSSPGVFTEFSRQRGLAPDGRCKSFSDSADGVGWGEGVGMLLISRLSEAERQGHPILAVLRGSAVNQDGASNGLTAPNGPSQERVIRQALANARLTPQDIDAVEAHGTGTTLGDPIEAGALLATYGQDRETPLRLGSIKSNIGHTQAAAGAAGVIKMVMAMREGLLPKSLHIDSPSSKVDWEAGEIELLTEPVSWQPNGKPRRAAVSSFGISGTNAHVVLEEAPAPAASDEQSGEGAPVKPLPTYLPLPLSAKTEPALREAASRLASHLKANPDLGPADVAYSLATGRTSFEHRAVALGQGREELLDALLALSEGATSPGATTTKATPGKLTYLFSGQGAQRAEMGKELYETHPVFKEALDQACAEIDPHLDRSLKDLLFASKGSKEAELLDHTQYTQPALFAIELALYRQLESQGLKPDLLAGHSIGEITAAHIAGVLDLSDAAKLICARGALMGELPAGGAMVAVEATEAEANSFLEDKGKELAIAAINSPSSVVLSGREEEIEEAQAHFEAQGKKTKRLSVSHAFHSPLIEPMLEDFAKLASSLSYAEPQIPIVSNLSGELLDPSQAQDPAYWVSQARDAVRFADSVKTLAKLGATTFVEIGPEPALSAMAAQTLEAEEHSGTAIPTLREGRDEAEALSGALARAHASGASVDWSAFFAGTAAKRVPLPTYPFQRKRYWLEGSANGGDPTAIGQIDAEHPLLGAAIALAGGEQWLFTGRLSLQTHPWLADHAIGDTVLLPGTAFLELALNAAERLGASQIGELTLQAPLIFSERGSVAIQLTASEPDEQGDRQIAIYSRAQGSDEEETEWSTHATGTLSSQSTEAPEPLDNWPPEGAESLDTDDLYERLAEAGLEYGPAFQGLARAWKDGKDVYAEVALAEEQLSEAERYGIHPALLDAALHGAALAGEAEGPKLPFSWQGVSLRAPGAKGLRVRLTSQGEGGISLLLAGEEGSPVARVNSLATRPLSPEQLQGARQAQQGLLGIEWQELSLPGQGQEETEAPQVAIHRPEQADPKADPPTAAKLHAEQTLQAIQEWLSTERPEDAGFALVTQAAIATTEGESPDLSQASLWGLLRSAQSEHPGAFVAIDTDGTEASEEAIARALASGEPQVALREGAALVPRATRIARPEEQAPGVDPDKTILITGATGALGSRLARHLIVEHGAKHLLLASRSGTKAKGAKELQAQLKELGAKAKIAACDVSDKAQVKELLGSIPKAHPLGAVIHTAGTIDDGLIDSMSPEQVERVFAPKADGAWNLHELTKGQELSAFVCFSSLAATLGGPGQSNYAAANAFLDALASQRKAAGLVGTSIAWGYWASEGAMTAGLSEIDRGRMERAGIGALSDEEGLELFDAALLADKGQPIAVRLIPASLRALAKAGALHPLLQGLVRVSGARSVAADSLARKLAAVPEAERERVALELVRSEVATVLGHASAGAIDPQRPFKELGFDSLAAVELRNRLSALSGLRLAPTIVFDYPTSAALAGYLLEEVGQRSEVSAQVELDRFEQALSMLPAEDPSRLKLATHLRALAGDLEDTNRSEGGALDVDRLESVSDEELLELIDQQVGSGEPN